MRKIYSFNRGLQKSPLRVPRRGIPREATLKNPRLPAKIADFAQEPVTFASGASYRKEKQKDAGFCAKSLRISAERRREGTDFRTLAGHRQKDGEEKFVFV